MGVSCHTPWCDGCQQPHSMVWWVSAATLHGAMGVSSHTPWCDGCQQPHCQQATCISMLYCHWNPVGKLEFYFNSWTILNNFFFEGSLIGFTIFVELGLFAYLQQASLTHWFPNCEKHTCIIKVTLIWSFTCICCISDNWRIEVGVRGTPWKP